MPFFSRPALFDFLSAVEKTRQKRFAEKAWNCCHPRNYSVLPIDPSAMKKITILLSILVGYLLSTVPCHAYRDLESGVFLSRDPAGHVDGPNVYTYVKQNPWTKFDPDGLKPESVNEFAHPDTGRTVGLMQMPGEFQRGYSKARGQAASLGADFIPFLGGFKGAYEVATGKDAITKEPLTTGQRVLAGIGTAVSWIPGGKTGVKSLGRLLSRGAKDGDKGAKTARGITKTSEQVVETVIQAEGPAAKATSPLRQAYIAEVEELKGLGASARAAGQDAEATARMLNAERRAIGVKYKDLTPADELARITARNIRDYSEPLGPTIDWLRAHGKSWEQIIESASRSGGKNLGY